MNKRTSCCGTVISAACCFGLLSAFFGILGLTTAVGIINRYGDYLFFPAYSFFGTYFVLSLLTKQEYALIVPVGVIAVYFASFGILYAALIIVGVLAALLVRRK